MKVTINEKRTPFLSEKMFGLFFEDINYGADGGLYAEMLENRQFAFRKSTPGAKEKTYDSIYAGEYGYEEYSDENHGGKAVLTFPETGGVSEQNPHYMSVEVIEGEAGFTNKAYDGICMKQDEEYCLTFFVKTAETEEELSFRVVDRTTGKVVWEVKQRVETTTEWTKYVVSEKALADVKNGNFAVIQKKGKVDYGYLSLMPANAVAGVFRKDLFCLLQEMNPGFLRFPGGCIVEGANLNNRYRWKDTVGMPWNRKWNWSRWAVHDVTMGQGEPLFFPFYNQSYGIGFYEYFLLAELLGAKPLPVLSVGLACQFQSDELVPVASEEFKEYLQDAVDLIEFANGDVTTKWGEVRAKMGHPEPFGLEYIGIGNEQWETEKVDFFARYSAFERAIHEACPTMKLLGSAGPDVTTEKYTKAWEFYRRECKKNPDFTHAVDEHYYMPPAWFYEQVHMYDSYSREIPVFAGEYAAHGEGKHNNWEAALAEAAFMCGLERNGDVIRFASAAPLFARKGYVQWIPDYIWFDGEASMGTPGYYVQKLFGRYTGCEKVDFQIEQEPSLTEDHKLQVSVSAKGDTYYVKVVNAKEQPVTMESLTLLGEEIPLEKMQMFLLQGASLQEENILGQPETIFLKEIPAEAKTKVVPGLACAVFVL